MTTSSALSKQYDPSEVEPRWLRFWNENQFFHADETSPNVPYSITLPPPNVTGSLHIGHALGSTLQDILIRWKRMQGLNAMWMPGIDHASIAVHVLLENALRKQEGLSRFDLGRDEFMKRAWAWKEKSGNRIGEQERLMGFSLDWPRERFTMDERSNKAVIEAFVRLYEEGLIFRAKRMINWDPKSQTVVSDLEIDTVEENGSLWEIKYPIVGGGEIVVATTRPETMLGDTAVVVHAKDERYQGLVGKEIELPLTGRRVPVVAVDLVRDGKPWPDPSFGSGAVKVTPAHDPNDYDVSQICDLPILQVIDFAGRMQAPAPEKYVGMTVEECRAAVVADLEAQGFLGTVKDYKVPRQRSQRGGAVIEPMLMEQWFVKAEPLAKKAIEAVEAGKTKFVPELHTKTFMHWMTNIRDWCISRQLWWGHRIPAWFCDACGTIQVAREAPKDCGSCGGAVRQDEDILDTWFSSGLWPFSTLGWPEQTRALKTFYPNSVLVTGPDIIFFWVARMMMMGLHFMGKVPFKTVYLTAIVTDENGDKMSKTKGNVLDPLDIIQGATLDELVKRAEADPNIPDSAVKAIKKNHAKEHDLGGGKKMKGIPPMGTDALRFALAALNTTGRIRLSVDRVLDYRNFINKLWNASRFALMNLDGYDPERFEAYLKTAPTVSSPNRLALGMPERWILSRLQHTAADVNAALEAFRFSDAAKAIYHFVWNELCDWYIELAKPHLHAGTSATGEQDPSVAQRRHLVQGVLATALETTMRLLHPFAPFVTEEIWQKLPKPPQLPGSLMITLFPTQDDAFVDAIAESEMQLVQDTVVTCRMLRQTYGVPLQSTIAVELRVSNEQTRALVDQHLGLITRSAKITATVTSGGAAVEGAAKGLVGTDVEIVMPLGGLIDPATESKRLDKDIQKADKEIAGLEAKLANTAFLSRAPEEVVAEIRERLVEEQTRRTRLLDARQTLGGGK